MSHNIEHTTYAASRVDDYVAPVFGSPGSDVPVVGDIATNPVLTVASRHYSPDQVSFLFYEGFDAASLVVNPWTEDAVHIVGEDLFALRELLNEMPEYAFTRPADPVVKSRWEEDDEVLEVNPRSGKTWHWVRDEEKWSAGNACGTLTDQEISHYVDSLKTTHLWIPLVQAGVAVSRTAQR